MMGMQGMVVGLLEGGVEASPSVCSHRGGRSVCLHCREDEMMDDVVKGAHGGHRSA